MSARMTKISGARRSAGEILRTMFVILGWYSISTTVILTSKWVLSRPAWGEGRKLFPFPLLLTTSSNTVATLWAIGFSRHRGFQPAPFPTRSLIYYVIPIGAVTALDLGCSNVALKLLDVSFGTIIKGASPIFTMLWALSFGIESFSVNVLLSLVAIGSGVALAAFGEGSHFMVAGFLLQLFATALAGLRWALTQILLKGEENRMPPMAVILYTSPATAICLAPVAVVREGTAAMKHLCELPSNKLALLAGLLIGIGSLVFVLLMSEYWLVECTSSLALSVCAVFKELLTIGGGVGLLHERLSVLNMMGFIICQCGIGSYVWFRSKRDANSKDTELDEVEMPLTVLDDPWDECPSPLPKKMKRARL